MAHVLLVDDEPAVREALAGLLARQGHHSVLARDGAEALDLYEEGTFDLIVSDVMMPTMNGFDLLQALLPRIHERVPFLIVSSHSDRESVKAAIYAGAFDYLLKPFEAEHVAEVVERALDQARAWAESGVVTPCPRVRALSDRAGPVSDKATAVEVLVRESKVVTVATPSERRREETERGRGHGWRALLARLGRRHRG